MESGTTAEPEKADAKPEQKADAKPEQKADAKPEQEADAKPEQEADAKADDEDDEDGLPERLRPMQRAGGWTLFAGFVVGTTAGVLAGLAEREEDKANRLASLYDDSGSQLLYAEHRHEYETILRRGTAFQNAGIALGAIAGAILIAGAVLFAVDARRQRRGQSQRARTRLRGGGFEVRF